MVLSTIKIWPKMTCSRPLKKSVAELRIDSSSLESQSSTLTPKTTFLPGSGPHWDLYKDIQKVHLHSTELLIVNCVGYTQLILTDVSCLERKARHYSAPSPNPSPPSPTNVLWKNISFHPCRLQTHWGQDCVVGCIYMAIERCNNSQLWEMYMPQLCLS